MLEVVVSILVGNVIVVVVVFMFCTVLLEVAAAVLLGNVVVVVVIFILFLLSLSVAVGGCYSCCRRRFEVMW